MANALWKYIRAGDVRAEEAVALLETAFGLADRVVPDRDLAEETLSVAASTRHPVYDLLHATLARRFGGTVVTLDGRLQRLLGEMGIPSWCPERR